MTDTRCHPCTAIGPGCEAVGCVNCDAVEYSPGSPAYNVYEPVQNWDAGANSIDTLTGDLHTVFNADVTGALVVGFKASRENVAAPSAVLHGLLLRSQGGRLYVSVVERGEEVTSPVPRVEGDTFEIRRVNGNVSYWQNSTKLHVSAKRSFDALVVNACLYMSGDTVQ